MKRLWIVRHGQSAGNVAHDLAQRQQLLSIDVNARDADVPLSDLGHEQALAVGKWLRAQKRQPTFVVSSPHLRTQQTAQGIIAGAELKQRIKLDERLREKELGLLNRVTRLGMEKNFPEQAALRTVLGKFYFRPPSGESWCDVILRLRSFLDWLLLRHKDDDVLIVTHSVVVYCIRYILEELDEAGVLAIDQTNEVANCGITIYDKGKHKLRLREYNLTQPLEQEHAPTTTERASHKSH